MSQFRDDAARDSEGSPELVIRNEFAEVSVRKVWTRNGERLQIKSLRRSGEVLLDSIELESLTWQTPETFSKMLSASIGPSQAD